MKRLNKLYIGTNTKMFKTIADSDKYLKELSILSNDLQKEDIQIFVIPSYTSLVSAKKVASKNIMIGAQNMAWEQEGQYTGEISPKMLSELNIDMVMIGHSERRNIFLEYDEMEALKVEAAIKNGFNTLLCVGESKKDKDYQISDERLRIQIKKGLYKLSKKNTDKLYIAYEPVWAIGVNGTPAEPKYIEEKHKAIKSCLAELFGQNFGLDIPVLYGGSVNNNNCKEIIKLNNVDGLFIGRSAWNANNFNKIIRDVLPIFKERKI